MSFCLNSLLEISSRIASVQRSAIAASRPVTRGEREDFRYDLRVSLQQILQALNFVCGFLLDWRHGELAPAKLRLAIRHRRAIGVPAAQPVGQSIADLDRLVEERIVDCARAHVPSLTMGALEAWLRRWYAGAARQTSPACPAA